MMVGYKIFDITDKGELKYLFHGINKSRVIKPNTWVKANKVWGRDGSGKTVYLTGFHFFKTLKEAKEWPGDMTGRVIAKIEARGVRRKEHSKWNVLLADEIRVIT